MSLVSALKKVLPQSIWPSRCARRTLQSVYGKAEVLGGPFRGMKYVSGAQGSVLIPKLLGIYEQELAGIIEQLGERNFANIYIIGAGEGYYAVGMAMKNPAAKVIAFEANESAHKLIKEVAERNGVDRRILIQGLCSDADMRSILPNSLIIMDVEGAEKQLLDPEASDSLRSCTILFEAHYPPEEMKAGILGRFGPSHEIERIDSAERTWTDVCALPRPLVFYIRRNIGHWIDEMRGGPMQWYLLTPRSRIS